MQAAPKWFRPVAVVALLWNALGCAAYLSDVMLTPEALAKMSAADQLLHAPRPVWAVAASALAVWGGAAGSLGLILRKRWANPLLLISLLGVVVQDVSMMMTPPAAAVASTMALQGMVLVVAVALVWLGRKAASSGWLA